MGEGRPGVLIAGAGPSGLTAGLELCRRGFSPRIVDSESGPAPMEESRALGVNARTLTLLSPSGVTDRILGVAQHITHFRVRSGSALLFELDTGRAAGAYRAIQAMPQGLMERLLLAALREYDVEPEWNTRVEAVAGDPTEPVVSIRHADGATESVRPDFLIGADGAHSVVRKSLGFGFPGEALETCFYLADYRYEHPVDARVADIEVFNPGILGHLPVTPDTLRYISTLSDYESRIVHPDKVVEEVWRSEFRVHFRHVESMSRGNVFLAGDAAHIHSPAGARGMNLGIEDACWLAYLLSEGRQQEYSSLRMPAVRQVMKVTYRLTAFITMKNPLLIGLRNRIVPMLLRIPPIGTRLLRGVAGYDTPPPPWIAGAE
ncbi:FAD-dependent monooxygenase [Rhizobiaceae bacterium n13]|uniref:FAD-dependent monooxygenase n=1 Tax=Ferirhizobium litorale TaxID=2927786 RepID=A0AAE3QJ76_9HYPH|nr:NAD(P)/FAD-dependent oxidoreductase [Fererhizobium litorale]MDI7863807.1 FAD-dependent monooxygenase [Fererhizobium litorale]MDI7924093.1 FAD-dependent monooxygenase [Fererhizobium litorale]